jgi:DNA integrity scanning protein DisA with diadenylate cyclase activity
MRRSSVKPPHQVNVRLPDRRCVVFQHKHELLALGAKIVRRKDWPQVEQATVTEPIEGATPSLVHPDQLGGTRHLSAAQFVQDQRNAVALVASQDGRFTIFEWSECEARCGDRAFLWQRTR